MNRPIIWQVVIVIANLLLLNLLFTKNAYAYTDPGSASYIYQIIVAVIIGGLVVVKNYWQRVKNIFIKHRDKDEDGDED